MESEPEKGARFEVYLPRVDEAVEAAASDEMAAAPARQRKTVLIAEDEEAVRELASEFIECAGYTVLTAKDGTEALAIAEQSDEPIHLLLTDVVMPKMRGTGTRQTTKGPSEQHAGCLHVRLPRIQPRQRRLFGGGVFPSKALLARYAGS